MGSDVVLITGASSGIGKATANILSKNGYKVYGTTRKFIPDDISVIQTFSNGGFFKIIQLDVRNQESVDKAVNLLLDKEGRIDVLVNNAGFGIAGPIEETLDEDAKAQFETNFFGVHRMCKKIIPIMRNQKSGIIANIGSAAGVIPLPFQAMYSATKFAIESYTESLRIEVAEFGIKVFLVEPGCTRTNFTKIRQFSKNLNQSIYSKKCKIFVGKIAYYETTGPSPDVVANCVYKMMNKTKIPVKKVTTLKFKAYVLAKRHLPPYLSEKVLIYILCRKDYSDIVQKCL